MTSFPSRSRTAAAVAIYLVAGFGAVVWKVLRNDLVEAGRISAWMAGSLPNLIPAAFLPMVVFASQRVVRSADYFRLVPTIWAALCAYEAAQVWMPGRTFDWADIAASTAGACMGCVLGWLVFLRWLVDPAPVRDRDKAKSDETAA